MDDNCILRLSGIHFAYPGRPELFKGLSRKIGKWERLGMVGSTGSGKTTIFRIIMGLNKPRAGRIELDGREISNGEDVAFLRREIGFLFQNSEDQLFCPTVAED